VKYADFQLITRSKSFPEPVCDSQFFLAAGQSLLAGLVPVRKGIRLIGLGLHNLTDSVDEPQQLRLAI
jgi:DNA polymerase IV